MNKEKIKAEFLWKLKDLVKIMGNYISTKDGQWKIKWFIDNCKTIYTISSDTKIVSKILEIHLFPLIQTFAQKNWYKIILAEAQNRYPDISFVSKKNENIKFAIDLKTTYRLPEKKDSCNWFTLGSHWEYFTNRNSTKNIQFPYNKYLWHYCLGIIYDRVERDVDDTKTYLIKDIEKIQSVISNFTFFACEKRKIASDKWGSGNTANIWSIKYIPDILTWKGTFEKLWETRFDDYWCNYGKMTIKDKKWWTKKLTNIEELLEYKGYKWTFIRKPRKNVKKSNSTSN